MTITLSPPHQTRQAATEYEMYPLPESMGGHYKPAKKLENKVAIITGSDSGIGRAVAYAFALEGANIALVYVDETEDALRTEKTLHKIGRECICFEGDVSDYKFCHYIIRETMRKFGHIDILVNNACVQHVTEEFAKLTNENLEKTFQTNIFSYFYMSREAVPHLHEGSSIINTASVVAYEGHPLLVDYSATEGAIVSFTRSLALNLAKKKIRVNGVAPGLISTPVIPASFTAEQVKNFGRKTPLGRPGQPCEVSPCYVFLASEDSSYMTGQILHPNGGLIINA